MSIADIASRIADAEPMRLSREWLSEGTHVIRIEDLLTITSQAGKEIAILEATILDSDSMTQGTPIKDMVSLSGEQAWRIDSNMRYLKSMIAAALPEDYRNQVSAEVIGRAFATETDRSVLEGTLVKVRVLSKISKNGKKYIEKNWIGLSKVEQDNYVDGDVPSEEIPF